MSIEEIISSFIETGKTLYQRGYASGAAGNMSALLPDGTVLASPSGSCLGQLHRDELSITDRSNNLLCGLKPTKEIMFHLAIYEKNPDIKAVIHLHSCYSTAYSCLKDLNPKSAIKPVTPYVVMRMGDIPLIPYYKPGSIHLAEEIAKVAAGHKGYLMANHGMIACGSSLDDAVNNAEELESACKIYFLLKDSEAKIRYLSTDEIAELR